MIVIPVHHGAPVEAVGTVVHTHAGPLLIADTHWDARQRRVADAALDVADDLGVVCGVGSGPLDDTLPAETVHILEVGWVPEALADALTAVPTGLVQLTTHVRVVRTG